MNISKTTFNFAEARGMFLSANNENSTFGYKEIYVWIDAESGEPDMTWIQNADGTLSFGNVFTNLKPELKEELPAWIKTEVEFRKVLDFMANA